MKCKQEQLKVRKSKVSEEAIKEMADVLKERYLTWKEIDFMAKRAGCNSGIESVLSLFEVRGYKVAEFTNGARTLYKIVTKQDYEKYETEATKDAKRRLLAAISY